jgi:hypothetical protein
MTWIRTVPPAEADERLQKALAALQALYPREYATPVHAAQPVPGSDQVVAGIVASHSLIPDALYHAFSTYGVLMSPDLPLGRRQHEMIATMVSLSNRCRY